MITTGHNFTQEEINHLNRLIEHYNKLHEAEKKRLAAQAADDDLDNLLSWVKEAGKALGVSFSAAGVIGVAWYFIKELKK